MRNRHHVLDVHDVKFLQQFLQSFWLNLTLETCDIFPRLLFIACGRSLSVHTLERCTFCTKFRKEDKVGMSKWHTITSSLPFRPLLQKMERTPNFLGSAEMIRGFFFMPFFSTRMLLTVFKTATHGGIRFR